MQRGCLTALFFAIFVFPGALPAQTAMVSNEEAMHLAHQVEASTNSGRTDVLDHLFDFDALLDNIFKKSKVLNENGEAFKKGFKGGFIKSMESYGTKILASSKDGSYRCLKASDCFIYLSDDDLSGSVTKMTDAMMAGMGATELPEDLKTFSTLLELTKKGGLAVNKLDSLLGKDPFLDFYRGAFYQLGGKKEESTLCFERVYKYDPSLRANAVALIKAYAENKQIDKAKRVIVECRESQVLQEQTLEALYTAYPGLK